MPKQGGDFEHIRSGTNSQVGGSFVVASSYVLTRRDRVTTGVFATTMTRGLEFTILTSEL